MSGLIVGLGAGLGLGYLTFGWRLRNSIGAWAGDGQFGIWGRRKRSRLREMGQERPQIKDIYTTIQTRCVGSV